MQDHERWETNKSRSRANEVIAQRRKSCPCCLLCILLVQNQKAKPKCFRVAHTKVPSNVQWAFSNLCGLRGVRPQAGHLNDPQTVVQGKTGHPHRRSILGAPEGPARQDEYGTEKRGPQTTMSFAILCRVLSLFASKGCLSLANFTFLSPRLIMQVQHFKGVFWVKKNLTQSFHFPV